MNRKLVVILLMIAVSMFFAVNANALFFGNPNLIKNGGFEVAAKDNFPKDWRLRDGLPPNVTVEISKNNPHSGKQCLMFNHQVPADTLVVQNLQVKPEKVYLITCWIRTENVAQQAGSANLTLYYGDVNGGVEGILTSQEFADTGNQWIKLEFPFRARKTKTPLLFGLRFGGQGTSNQGTVYFDDVVVKEVPNRDDAIGFYLPGGENGAGAGAEGSTATPFVPSNALIFVTLGTLLVGFLVFLEFNLSQKEKKEQAEAEKAVLKSENEDNQAGQVESEQPTGAPDENKLEPID